MQVNIKLGPMVELSGATARTFEVVPQAGSYKDDAVYQRGLAVERNLAKEESGESTDKKSNCFGAIEL